MRINAKRRVVDKYVSCLQTYKIFGQDVLTALENQIYGHHAKQVNIKINTRHPMLIKLVVNLFKGTFKA